MKQTKRYVICCILLVIFGMTVFSATNWSKIEFNVELDQILYTFASPLDGSNNTATILSALKYCVPWIMSGGIIVYVFLFLEKKINYKERNWILKNLSIVLSVTMLISSLVYAGYRYSLVQFVSSRIHTSTIYEDYYVDPNTVQIINEGEKRNLIYIYLESMETTYASVSEGGICKDNYIPELTELAYDNISFSNGEKLGGFFSIPGTTWTMGALFSTTSGVPFSFPVGGNDMADYATFASGITTLGDFLANEGYQQEFLCGSNISFAGRDKYFLQHGNYKLFDYYSAIEDGYIASDYKVGWGYEDEILYQIAKDEVLMLASEQQPFNLTILTVDTHFPTGTYCNLCEDRYEEIAADVVRCASEQVVEFVAWCMQQDFYEDTVIIITGDHPRMDTDIVGDTPSEERTIYNCFINSNREAQGSTINRSATAMDIFPTVVYALGYSIEGERLGLGTNLYSTKETLMEEMGYDALVTELSKKSKYYDKFR